MDLAKNIHKVCSFTGHLSYKYSTTHTSTYSCSWHRYTTFTWIFTWDEFQKCYFKIEHYVYSLALQNIIKWPPPQKCHTASPVRLSPAKHENLLPAHLCKLWVSFLTSEVQAYSVGLWIRCFLIFQQPSAQCWLISHISFLQEWLSYFIVSAHLETFQC